MVNKAEVAVIKILAGRFKEARELCQFYQGKASELLDVDVDFLKQLESGIDVDSVPLWLITKAAKLYDVSVDYLFGFSDDWEKSEEVKWQREIGAWIYQAQFDNFSKMGAEIIRQQRQLEVLTGVAAQMLPAISDVDEALLRFRELNPGFDNLKAGAMLVSRIKIAKQTAKAAHLALVRLKAMPREELNPSEAEIDD